jgi:hypothetical protein
MADLVVQETPETPGLTPLRSRGGDLSRSCGWCGRSLVGLRLDARYCSTSHRVLAHRRRKRESA